MLLYFNTFFEQLYS